MTFYLTATKYSTLFRYNAETPANQTIKTEPLRFTPTAAHTLRALSQMDEEQRHNAVMNISSDPRVQQRVKMELAEQYFLYDDAYRGIALLAYVAQVNGWERIENIPENYRVVGILHDRSPLNEQGHEFPEGKVFSLELSDRLGNIIYARNYLPHYVNNRSCEWHQNILDQIHRAMPVSGLQSKNHLLLGAITAQSYNTSAPEIEIGSVNSSRRNLFLVKNESDVYDVAWRVVAPEPAATTQSSVWLRRVAESKPGGYRQSAAVLARKIAQISQQNTNATTKAVAVFALLSRRINDAEGKWLNDFKGFLNHWLKQQTQIGDALDVRITATYYEALTSKYPSLRSAAYRTASIINPVVGQLLERLTYDEKTVSQSFWTFLQQRRDFFNPREIRLEGVPYLRLRSGAPLTFDDNFQHTHFSLAAAGNSSVIRSCVNNPAILRTAWENYVEALFADNGYFSAHLSVLDLSLSASLDRVITGQYPAYAALNATQQRAYSQHAEAIRVGKQGAILLQHKGDINALADRLILISSGTLHEYLACSVSVGNAVFHPITFKPDGNNLRVTDNVIDFLQHFFPGGKLEKSRRILVPTAASAQPVEVTLQAAFSLVNKSNPLLALAEAHKLSRKQIAEQLFNSAAERAALSKLRFYDRLIDIVTDVALVVPFAEPLALEALALEGVEKMSLLEGLQLSGKVINTASLALPVFSQWERYKHAAKQTLQAQREFLLLVETLETNALLAAPAFMPEASAETRYRQAKERISAPEINSESALCRSRRTLWPALCTAASIKATKYAESFTLSLRHGAMQKSCWDFVVDVQRQAGMISVAQALLLLRTRAKTFKDFIGKDALVITSTAQLRDIPYGARLAFTVANAQREEEIHHAMIYMRDGRAAGVNNQWLTTHIDLSFSSSASQVDLSTDLAWGMAGPLNSRGEPIKMYAQSLQDIRRPVLVSELFQRQVLYPAPARGLKAIALNDLQVTELSDNLAAGLFPNHLAKSHFLRGSKALNAFERQSLTETLTLINRLPTCTQQEAAALFHGDAISLADSAALKQGELIQSHQLTFFSPDIFVANYFKQFAEKEIRVIYRLPVEDAGKVSKLDILPLHYTRIKNHYLAAEMDHAAGAIQTVTFEGVIPPGQIFRVVKIEEQILARDLVKVIELEYMLREEKILARSFNGMDYIVPA